jgi:acid phosphatase type 7
MLPCSRRSFLGASLAGLATAPLLAQDKPAASPLSGAEDYAFQPSTLFLTWQRDPTTTMTIQWIGVRGETADTQIYYLPQIAPKAAPWAVQATTPRPYPMSDFKVFRAELTGLVPDTAYQFKIGKQSPTYRFRTMPVKATNTIHFISGGDLGYDNGTSVGTSLAFLRNYSKHMVGRDGRLIPLVACIGNHEVDGGYNKKRDKAPFFYALFDGLYRETSYATLDFSDYLSLVLLDTGHNTPIAGQQTTWLEKTLKERVDHPNVMVVNHVPAYPSFRKMESEKDKDGKEKNEGTGEGNRKYWVPLFDKYRVPVVLEHHDHTFKRSKTLIDGTENNNGVLYLGDGSWGRLRAPQKPERLPFLAASSQDYHLSLHRIQGEERFHLALDEFGRVMDISRSGQRKRGSVSVSG